MTLFRSKRRLCTATTILFISLSSRVRFANYFVELGVGGGTDKTDLGTLSIEIEENWKYIKAHA